MLLLNPEEKFVKEGIANIKKIVCNKALIQWFCRLHSDLPQCYNESIYFIA